MASFSEVRTMIHQAHSGDMPPQGNLEAADEVFGFSFGTCFNSEGQLLKPGPVNEALAAFIVGHEVLCSMPMTLQQEVAMAVQAAREPGSGGEINSLPSLKAPFKAFNTHELITIARPGLVKRGVKSVAVVAFRHHLPRAAAEVKRAGFVVATPDMRAVGDFDPRSDQAWTHDREAWDHREPKVIAALALLGCI